MINYVVSGWMRSGTSMMMQALQVGGMTVTSSEERDQFARQASDDQYTVNPAGLFELPLPTLTTEFPQNFVGQVVKLVVPWLHLMKPFDGLRYKVLFMHRDSEEIRQDYEAAFTARASVKTIEAQVREGLRGLQSRSDTDVLVVPYRSMVFNPGCWMQQIRYAGWPIDVERAASIVDPVRYTFRREQLVVGL